MVITLKGTLKRKQLRGRGHSVRKGQTHFTDIQEAKQRNADSV